MSRLKALRRPPEFKRVLEEGYPLRGPRFTAFYLPGERGVRAGFVCGRRVGSAVARNRARRVLRNAWRSVGPQVAEAYDVVFVAGPAMRGAKTPEVAADMSDRLRAARVAGR